MTQSTNDYSWRRTGTCGCELLDADGTIVAWSANESWAMTIVRLLNDTDLSHGLPGPMASYGVVDEAGNSSRQPADSCPQ